MTIRTDRPHWTRAKTLLLPIAAEAWPELLAQVRLDGVEFRRKRELHATIVGHALSTRVRDAMARDRRVRAALDGIIAALDWRWTRGHDWRLLCKQDRGGRRLSVIELIELPAMAQLHQRLQALLDDTLSVPPAHVTLYTAGSAKGIGVPDGAALGRLQLRAVSAVELRLDTAGRSAAGG